MSSSYTKTSLNSEAGRPDTRLARRLADRADGWFTRTRASVLDSLPCRRGCAQCCVGPFTVTILDVDRLQDGVQTLSHPLRSEIRDRAMAQVESIDASFPQLQATPFLDDWDDADIDRLVSSYQDRACPALQPDGACSVYAWRPATCRLMGIPVEEDGLAHGACQIQTFVPILRVPEALREEERNFARQEAGAIDVCRQLTGARGEEVLSPYAFLPERVWPSPRCALPDVGSWTA